MKRNPESKFVKLRCPKCKNEQITFGKVSSAINCHVCQEPLAQSTGGKTRFITQPLEQLE
jgi:small subunit ribosomal protein S27e